MAKVIYGSPFLSEGELLLMDHKNRMEREELESKIRENLGGKATAETVVAPLPDNKEDPDDNKVKDKDSSSDSVERPS